MGKKKTAVAGSLEKRRAFDLKAKAYGTRKIPMVPGEAQFINDLVDEVGPGMVIWFYAIASHDASLPPSRAMRYVRKVAENNRNGEFVTYGSERRCGRAVYDLQAVEVYLEQGRLKKARRLAREVLDHIEDLAAVGRTRMRYDDQYN